MTTLLTQISWSNHLAIISKAKTINLESVFILTTQTADWFESLGFKMDTIDSIPESRIKIWNPDRGSKVYRLNLI